MYRQTLIPLVDKVTNTTVNMYENRKGHFTNSQKKKKVAIPGTHYEKAEVSLTSDYNTGKDHRKKVIGRSQHLWLKKSRRLVTNT